MSITPPRPPRPQTQSMLRQTTTMTRMPTNRAKSHAEIVQCRTKIMHTTDTKSRQDTFVSPPLFSESCSRAPGQSLNATPKSAGAGKSRHPNGTLKPYSSFYESSTAFTSWCRGKSTSKRSARLLRSWTTTSATTLPIFLRSIGFQ